jgi:hypothetical protein
MHKKYKHGCRTRGRRVIAEARIMFRYISQITKTENEALSRCHLCSKAVRPAGCSEDTQVGRWVSGRQHTISCVFRGYRAPTLCITRQQIGYFY